MPIYLDNNATTAPHVEVMTAFGQAQARFWGNPSSPHVIGREVKGALHTAKLVIANTLGSSPSELVFTSGATEANNLALAGVFAAEQLRKKSRRRLLISSIEHPSVLEAASALEGQGAVVQQVPVDLEGRLDLKTLEAELDEDVLIVSVMAANNEVGTLQQIPKVAALGHQVGALCHTDATQWLGRISVDVRSWGVDLLSASAHKLHGPKGIGLLFVKGGTQVAAQLHGGGHQGGRRSGTIDVPAVMAFAKALELIPDEAGWHEVEALREQLFKGLLDGARPITRISPAIGCLPNTISIRFHGVDAEALIASTPNICCSPGSACSNATPQPSHVLLAMGLDREAASETLRFSLSPMTTAKEVDQAVKEIIEGVQYVRSTFEMAA